MTLGFWKNLIAAGETLRDPDIAVELTFELSLPGFLRQRQGCEVTRQRLVKGSELLLDLRDSLSSRGRLSQITFPLPGGQGVCIFGDGLLTCFLLVLGLKAFR